MKIRKFIGVDTLGYLSVEGLLSAVTRPPDDYCTACFTGDYPVPVRIPRGKMDLEEGDPSPPSPAKSPRRNLARDRT